MISQPSRSFFDQLYAEAEKSQSFLTLIPFPYLLWRWQIQHPKDNMAVAKIASHRIGIHRWCEGNHDCDSVGELIRSQSAVKKDVRMGGQSTMGI